MYGTVARMAVKPGTQQALAEYWEAAQGVDIPGLVASYVYQMDENSEEYYLAVVFDSKEAYRANAESPGQNERYLQLRALLAADPEWHDGQIVSSNE